MARIKLSALALALCVSTAHAGFWAAHNICTSQDNDPHKPRPRSKGEKARNKRYRK